MKKKKHPDRWIKQTFRIELYKGIGFFRKKVFYVRGTTVHVVMRNFEQKHPKAEILSVSPFEV